MTVKMQCLKAKSGISTMFSFARGRDGNETWEQFCRNFQNQEVIVPPLNSVKCEGY